MTDDAPQPKPPSNRESEVTERRVANNGAPDDPQTATSEGSGRERRVREVIRHELVADAEDEARAEQEAEGEPSNAKPVIELRDVSLAFDRPILEKVSFAAHEGETVVVVGESGTGKSTILKLILRLLAPDEGHVYVKGEEISQVTYEEALGIRQHMGMVFQGSALFDSLSVFENVAYPLREHTDLDDDAIEQRVREKLQYVDLDPEQVMDLSPAELSGGMQKRVGIARGLAANPEIMLYDEPTSGLDPLTTATITHLILKLQRDLHVTSVVVSHDIRSAFRMASKVALLADQHITFFGTPEEMAASDDRYIQSFLGGY
jgi:phospholipid/cholesterol/gamma-HCH transport system ATP-binding protein